MKNFLSIGLFSICTILALTAYSKEVSLDTKKLDDINVSRLEEKIDFHGKQYKVSELSDKTLEWLKWYNKLSKENKLAVNYVPAQLCEKGKDEKVIIAPHR